MERIIATSDFNPKQAHGALARDLVCAARFYSSGRRGILLLATVAALVGIAFSWSWLVAAGIAPLLLTALPCLVMCGLGLCMNKLLGGSCESNPMQSKMTEPIQSETATLTNCQDESPTEQVRCQAGAAPKAQAQFNQPREEAMRKFKTVLLLIATLVGGLAGVSLLHAQDGKKMPSTPMGQGMVRDDNGGSGMMGRMKMMQGMSGMMDHCDGMMNRSRPNDQWRNEKPSGPTR